MNQLYDVRLSQLTNLLLNLTYNTSALECSIDIVPRAVSFKQLINLIELVVKEKITKITVMNIPNV